MEQAKAAVKKDDGILSILGACVRVRHCTAHALARILRQSDGGSGPPIIVASDTQCSRCTHSLALDTSKSPADTSKLATYKNLGRLVVDLAIYMLIFLIRSS